MAVHTPVIGLIGMARYLSGGVESFGARLRFWGLVKVVVD
jgi:hypothetical protein